MWMFILFGGKHEKINFIWNTGKPFEIKSKLLVCLIFYTCISFSMYIVSWIGISNRNHVQTFFFVDYHYILYSPNIPVLALLRLRKSAPLLTSRSGVWVMEVNWRLMSETLTVSYLLPNLHLPMLQPISCNIENATWNKYYEDMLQYQNKLTN